MEPVTNAATPAVQAKLAVIPTNTLTPKETFMESVKDLSNEDFCVRVTSEIIRRGLILPEKKLSTTKGGRDTVWGAWDLGTGSGLYKSIDLTPIQSRELNTVHGVPMGLGLRVTILDVVPQAQSEGRRKERQVQTATREANRAGSVSTNVLLEELNKRRIAEGKPALTEI